MADLGDLFSSPLKAFFAKSAPSLRTFNAGLDQFLGERPFPMGSLTEICGEAGSGKSQWCLHLCAVVQLPLSMEGLAGSAVYLDTEGSFNGARMRQMADATRKNALAMLDQAPDCQAYYGPGGTSLYYPIAPPGSNTAPSTFHPGPYGSPSGQGGPTLSAFNGGVSGPISVGQCGIPAGAGVLQASSFSAAHASLSQQLAAQAAAVAAAASQHQLGVPSMQPQTSHSSSGSLSCSPSIPVTANGTHNSSLLAMSSLSSSPAAKKFRPAYARPSSKSQRYIPKPLPAELGNLKLYSSPDILICGNCREMFSDLVDMIEHKKHYCKLRFTCKCDMTNDEACLNGSLCSTTNSGDPDDHQTSICRILVCTFRKRSSGQFRNGKLSNDPNIF
ncbi:uncharacterized protein LOC131884414 isoform X2 [Tigriopus californicus]|uniref:uncharacterized protein LOC131884414 isoform X2 n=1 Tax=Tigriopus californicus TaxID=6832 RepID=UPI0027DA7742|nr:uncharacterized protein LOC131884414 isoform X2 [Tigriopus californicus]